MLPRTGAALISAQVFPPNFYTPLFAVPARALGISVVQVVAGVGHGKVARDVRAYDPPAAEFDAALRLAVEFAGVE